jgi:predicted Zn-dependent peptidase
MRYRYRQSPSKLSTLMVTTGGGARAGFGKYPNGMAHFYEHMAFKGSSAYTAKQLLWKVATAGGSWNAWTSEDLVSYHITIPEENIAVAFECLEQIVNKPIFPTEEIEKEKDVVCQEIRMYQDDLGTLVSYAMMESIFDHSLAIPIAGNEESVKLITQDNLIDFNHEFYNHDKQLVTLCSTVDHNDLVEKHFGKPDNCLIWRPKMEPNYRTSFTKEVIKPGQLQHIISMSFAGKLIDAVSKREAEFAVFNKIFGGSDVARLFLAIREDKGLVYGIYSSLDEYMDGNVFNIGTQTEPENSEIVLKEIDNQIELMKHSLPSEEELRSAKNKIRSREYGRLDSSGSIAHRIVSEEFYAEKNITEQLAEVEAVTAEQVKEIAEQVFSDTKYIVIGHE